jgi:hypothetical protein
MYRGIRVSVEYHTRTRRSLKYRCFVAPPQSRRAAPCRAGPVDQSMAVAEPRSSCAVKRQHRIFANQIQPGASTHG